MVTAVLPSSAKRALSAKAAAWPSILRRGERGITRPLSAAAGVRRQSPERSCRDPCRRRAGSVRPAPRRGRPPPGRGAAALSTGAATLRFARRREGISRCTAAGIPGQTRHAAAPVLESGKREVDVLACPKIVGGEIRAGAVVLAKSPSTYRNAVAPAARRVGHAVFGKHGLVADVLQNKRLLPPELAAAMQPAMHRGAFRAAREAARSEARPVEASSWGNGTFLWMSTPSMLKAFQQVQQWIGGRTHATGADQP